MRSLDLARELRGVLGAARNRVRCARRGRRLAAHARENERLPRGLVLLAGDSLFEAMASSGAQPACWVNRGVSGDRLRDLRERLEVSVIDAPCTRVALCIGTNDLMHDRRDPDELAAAIVELADAIAAHGRCVFVHELPPGEPPLDHLAGPIRRTNAALRSRLPARHPLVPLHSELSADVPPDGWTRDGIHLERRGYERWVALLARHLENASS